MAGITSISWYTFFIGILILLLVWLFSNKTKVGRSIVQNHMPWSLHQWDRVLLVLGSTLFILVNPVFHLVTALVIIVLYHLFVGQNIKAAKNPGKLDVPDKLRLFDDSKDISNQLSALVCKRLESVNEVADRMALYRCLFSFPFIAPDTRPSVKFLEGEYYIEFKLTDEKFTSSLFTYLKDAGFTLTTKRLN